MNMKTKEFTTEEKFTAAEIQKHALAHYNEDGWDYVVECMGVEEIWEILYEGDLNGNAWNGLFDDALRIIAEHCRLLNDVRSDIQGTAF
jgi:hypothetical protein